MPYSQPSNDSRATCAAGRRKPKAAPRRRTSAPRLSVRRGKPRRRRDIALKREPRSRSRARGMRSGEQRPRRPPQGRAPSGCAGSCWRPSKRLWKRRKRRLRQRLGSIAVPRSGWKTRSVRSGTQNCPTFQKAWPVEGRVHPSPHHAAGQRGLDTRGLKTILARPGGAGRSTGGGVINFGRAPEPPAQRTPTLPRAEKSRAAPWCGCGTGFQTETLPNKPRPPGRRSGGATARPVPGWAGCWRSASRSRSARASGSAAGGPAARAGPAAPP